MCSYNNKIKTEQRKNGALDVQNCTWKILSRPHGRLANYVDIEMSNSWHKSSLFPETNGFMCAVQDQVISTRNFYKYIHLKG